MMRPVHGLQGQVNYTWSHCLDYVSNGGFLSFSSAGILSPLPGELPVTMLPVITTFATTSRRNTFTNCRSKSEVELSGMQ